MGKGGLMGVIRTPLGILVLFVVMLTLAGITAYTAISGQLTAAAITGVSLFVLVVLLVVINAVA